MLLGSKTNATQRRASAEKQARSNGGEVTAFLRRAVTRSTAAAFRPFPPPPAAPPPSPLSSYKNIAVEDDKQIQALVASQASEGGVGGRGS